MKYGRSLAALWIAFQAAACQSPTTPEVPTPPKPDPVLSVTAVSEMRPGHEATISGKNLSLLSSLTVGGVTVSFEPVSEAQARFVVPDDISTACDVEGRPIDVIANGTAKGIGRLDLEQVVSMKVGESRILSSEDLSCLQLPAGREEYVLHVSDFRAEFSPAERVFRLRTQTADGEADAGVQGFSASRAAAHHHGVGPTTPSHSMARALQMTAASAGEPVVVEPRLGEAQVGDTVRLVDWREIGDPQKTQPDDSFLFDAVVVAVAGNHVIMVDTRYPDADRFTRTPYRTRLEQAARMVDETAIPAIRAVIDPEFEVPQGAGDRTFTVITPKLPYKGGAGSGNDLYGKEWYPLSAETVIVSVNGAEDWSAGTLASIIAHEMAHSADALNSYRNGFRGGSKGWFGESLAEQVAETAARIALGTEEGAKKSLTGSSVVPSLGNLSLWPSFRTDASPYQHIGFGGVGPYDSGARIVLFAREKLGEMGFNPSGPTLYQRLSAMGRWDVAAIAEVVGMSVRELLEQAHLASLTDDRVAGPHALPQYRTWDTTPEVPGDYSVEEKWGHLLSRTAEADISAEVSAGHHQHWYVGADADRGLTVQVSETDLKPHHQVRLTRLR